MTRPRPGRSDAIWAGDTSTGDGVVDDLSDLREVGDAIRAAPPDAGRCLPVDGAGPGQERAEAGDGADHADVGGDV
jgi:hypothetical protein